MEINMIQKQCAEIIKSIDSKKGIIHDDELSIVHITEELGEISRQILNPVLNRDKKDINNLAEELADVVFFISKIADNNNINLEKSIINKMQNLKSRFDLK